MIFGFHITIDFSWFRGIFWILTVRTGRKISFQTTQNNSIQSHNLGRSSGTTDELAIIPFYLVLFSAALVELAKSIPVHYLILSSYLFFCLSFFLLLSLCPVELSLLNQKTSKHGRTILASVSWPGSGVRHILQWLLGSFCEPPHWWHDPYKKCSRVSGSISFQKPAFFSLTLKTRSIIRRNTEVWKWQGSASASPLIQEICCYLSKWASAF